MRFCPLLIGLLIIIWSVPSFAQDSSNYQNYSSTVPIYARYEVVQSPLLARLTLRLDRFTGSTDVLTKSKNGMVWQPLDRISMHNDLTHPGKINYQIFLSGIMAKLTLLINTNTGDTWMIMEDPKVGIYWGPVSSQ